MFLQQAGGVVNSLYPGSRPVLVVHHEQEVAEHPDTFVETRLGRIYVPRGLRQQVRSRVQQVAGLTPAQREARYQELVTLIRQQILDDKRIGTEEVLREIDLVALTERAHVEVHRRRRRRRR